MNKIKSFLCLFAVVFVITISSFSVSAGQENCNHYFKKYVSDGNATCFSDGTKTAVCEKCRVAEKTVTDKGSKLVLSKPDKISATQTVSSITLNWSAVKGATGYQVFYKTSGEWKKLGSTKKTSCTISNLKSGFKVWFSVRPYAKSGSKTVVSKKCAFVYTGTKCTAPKKIVSSETTNSITLKWSAVARADGYRVYYKTSKGWKTLTSSTKARTVTYKNLASGKKLTFAVRSYIKTDKVIWSDYKTVTASTVTATPSLSVKFISKGKLKLSWNAVNGADGYQIYYKKDNGNSKLYKFYKKPQTVNLLLKGDCHYTFYIRSLKKSSDKILYSKFDSVLIHIGKSADRIVVDPYQEKWSLVMVNNDRELPENYQVKLSYIIGGFELDYRVAPYFNAMYEAAAEQGISLYPNSAYRSNDFQQSLFNQYTEQYMYSLGVTRTEAETIVKKEVMAPGTSEHNLGFAVDIGFIDNNFKYSAAYNWLSRNAHKYGFIERYTTEKQHITKIIPEPWHWRFVGVEYAAKIKKSGLCLEEYLEKYKLL